MSLTIYTTDERRYLLMPTEVDRDRCDDCDVAVIDVSIPLLTLWLAQMDLARELAAVHGCQELVYDRDYHAEFYQGDWDAAPEEDEDGTPIVQPVWTEQARLDNEQRHVRADSVWWEGLHHYGDPALTVATSRLERAALLDLVQQLAAEDDKECGTK